MNAPSSTIQSNNQEKNKEESVSTSSIPIPRKQHDQQDQIEIILKSPQKSIFRFSTRKELKPLKITKSTKSEEEFFKVDLKTARKPIRRKVSFKDKSWYDGEWDNNNKKHGHGL